MTGPDDGIERLRAALAAAPAEGDEAGKTEAARIFDALHGELDAEERRAVIASIAQDPEAAEAWRLAHDLAPPAEVSVHTPAPAAPASWRWLGLAAGIALVLGLAWQFVPRPADAPVYRGEPAGDIASLLPAGVPLARTSPVLRWTPLDGARYHVRLFAVDLRPLAEADGLLTAEYVLPPDVLAALAPGATLLWQVEARVSGAEPLVSPTFSTTVQ
ncbi:MAG: hypothetical protein R2712_03330 [Vicinamibacterales bacterium]